MIDDIEDNYPEYLSEERGYRWDAWDVLPADVIRRHDGISRASEQELAELDPGTLDDLDRWAYARSSRRHDAEGFASAARLIAASSASHRGIDYAGVFVELIEFLADAQAADEALLHVRTFRERWPEDSRAARLEVYVGARNGALDSVLGPALDEVGDDGERLLEIAEDLLAVGQAEEATGVLDRAEKLAIDKSQRALALDIDLLRRSLTE